MVANIRTGATVGGALRYNEEKVNRGQAEAVHLSAGCYSGIGGRANLRRATTADSEKEEKVHESALIQPHIILHRHNEHPSLPPGQQDSHPMQRYQENCSCPRLHRAALSLLLSGRSENSSNVPTGYNAIFSATTSMSRMIDESRTFA